MIAKHSATTIYYWPASVFQRSAKFLCLSCLFLLGGCSLWNTDTEMVITPPYTQVSTYSDTLFELGKMSDIYNSPFTKIQSTFVTDNTGASRPLATGAEIQRDITEIVKSTLNSIGGKILFIEYDPSYINNQVATGYSTFREKVVPDIVISGGITGFDRALETLSDTFDFGVDLQFPNIQHESDVILPPSQLLGGTYSNSQKEGLARITLDFNMKSFKTLAGLPYMTSTHSILVHKSVLEKNLSVTIFGPTFGLKGSTKKVQGRHQAVRVLVQSCMINLVGRYLALPYWRLLGEDARPDPIVLLQLDNSYYQMNEFDRLVKTQIWLFVHGYQIDITGEMDAKTLAALEEFSKSFNQSFDPKNPTIHKDLFQEIYLNLPLDGEALSRRLYINKLLS